MKKERLQKLFDSGKSIRQVAAVLRKSKGSVRYWMMKYGIQSTHRIARSWTDQQVIDLVPTSECVSDVVRGLGLDPRGANHRRVKRVIQRLKLDTAHFKSVPDRMRGKSTGRGIPLSEILVKNSAYESTSRLKIRLVRDGYLEDRCYICGQLPTWNGKTLVMRLDHINGEHSDHRKKNLRLVCPNCDSQLPTFGSRNRRKMPS